MKIAIVGDIHLGKNTVEQVKKDKIFKSQQMFFDTLALECEKQDIKEIIWTGDIFDTTKSVESNIIQYGVQLFHDKFRNFKHHIILGNHCLYNRDSLDVSSLACLEYLPNVNVYRKPTRVDLLGRKFLFTPYLVSGLFGKFSQNIEKLGKNNDVIVGHFDIIGARMENGSNSVIGLDMNKLLDNVKLTISGHYHNISEYNRGGNKVQYVGTPYQMTFGDAGDTRGFWTIDDNLEMDFIENEVSYKFIKTNDKDVDKLSDINNYFIHCEYPSDITDEELFKLTKKLENLSPITFKTEPKSIEKIDDIPMSKEDEIKIAEMSSAINVGDMLKVCDVFMEVEPPKNKDIVSELLKKIKDRVK